MRLLPPTSTYSQVTLASPSLPQKPLLASHWDHVTIPTLLSPETLSLMVSVFLRLKGVEDWECPWSILREGSWACDSSVVGNRTEVGSNLGYARNSL